MALLIDHPHHLSLTCSLHPDESFTGFCPSCLRDRLSALEPTPSAATSAVPHRNSASAISASLKSIFFKPPSSSSSSSSSSLQQPELRRSKSFSVSRHSRPSLSFEPQRKSCDVRGRNTLWSLFNQDDVTTGSGEIQPVAGVDEITAADPDPDPDPEPEEKVDLEPAVEIKKPPPAPAPASRSIWLAASAFSKKLQKWRRKQKAKKMKKQEEKEGSSRRFRETQSEVAVDAFGRRSCDLDPRFSLDAGRISFDDPRYSFDEPRASWDGYLVGIRSGFPRLPPMLSVIEDAPIPIQRSDGLIPVEEDLGISYTDSASRSHRSSLDRSGSVRNSNFEVNETHSSEFFRDWSSSLLRNDRCQSFESTFRDDSSRRGKKSKRWSKAWSIWGLIHRRGGGRNRGGDNVEPWPELGMNGFHNNGRISRSNSSLSSQSFVYSNGGGGFGSMRRKSTETNGIGKKRRGDEFVLERNRSLRHCDADDGRLRFYAAPMRGSRRWSGMSRSNKSGGRSFARNL